MDLARRVATTEQAEELDAPVLRALRNDFHAPVGHVARPAGEPQLQSAGPGPPAEADPLDPPTHPGGDPHRGLRWHFGQLKEERFMNGSRLIGVPQREHGCSRLPYASRERSK